ncbi:hypothetical protein [Aliiruegeria sabulilitoris]|uniref:hypothetical protein n=1 Tax=Aliiruegeria sabulilitoris TaxID=1510458 RepID=UPI00082B2CEB|nr:hypothetical protein [Aliiruegeria sabulilitoris]NDR58326.1 hypothetical protein [Pseudoruegeria sp. M32A2M]
MTSDRKVTIHEQYYEYAKRYAELSGMSVKGVVEYAIERTVVPELMEFGAMGDEPPPREADKLIERANRLLPGNWLVSLDEAFEPSDSEAAPPMICVSAGVDVFGATRVSKTALRNFIHDLDRVAEHGGRALLFNECGPETDSLQVRRRGNGLIFEKPGSGRISVTRTSVATRNRAMLIDAFNLAIQAQKAAEDGQ